MPLNFEGTSRRGVLEIFFFTCGSNRNSECCSRFAFANVETSVAVVLIVTGSGLNIIIGNFMERDGECIDEREFNGTVFEVALGIVSRSGRFSGASFERFY